MSQIASPENDFRLISISQIKTDSDNEFHAREWIDPDAVKAIAASIKQGQLYEPIILMDLKDGTYKVVDGEHRLKAHIELGKDEIMAHVIPDKEAIIWGLKANMTRSDYTPIEKSNALKKLLDRRVEEANNPEEYNQDSLAAEMKLSKGTISDYLCLQSLPQEVKDAAVKDRSCSVITLRSIARSGYKDEKKLKTYNDKVKSARIAAEKRATAEKKIKDTESLSVEEKKAILKEKQKTRQPRAYKKLEKQKSIIDTIFVMISDVEKQIEKEKKDNKFTDTNLKETLAELGSAIKELTKKVSAVEKIASIEG